jgi:hypothetical protein
LPTRSRCFVKGEAGFLSQPRTGFVRVMFPGWRWEMSVASQSVAKESVDMFGVMSSLSLFVVITPGYVGVGGCIVMLRSLVAWDGGVCL